MPYFWDELGVYARGALYMHDNGIGLFPAALPPELSRGHPLLFYCIPALGFNIFGDSVLAGHLTALVISLFFLWSVFYIVSKQYSRVTALSAVILIMVQPLFFAQSVMILPEILLACFMLWSLHCWTNKKYIGYALFSAAAMLVKETAIILPVVIISAALLQVITTRKIKRIHPLQLLVIMPFIIYGVFLMIQHQQNGWYFFPLHENNLHLDPVRFKKFIADFTQFVAIEQGRVIMSITGGIILIILIAQKRIQWHPFSVALIFLLIGGILFNGLNFYMNRYMLFVMIGYVLLNAVTLNIMMAHFRPAFILFPLLIAAGAYTMNGHTLLYKHPVKANIEERFDYDENMSYVRYLDLEQKAAAFVESHQQEGMRIYTNFPVGFTLIDPRLGFTHLQVGKDFTYTDDLHDPKLTWAIIVVPGSYDYVLPDTSAIGIAARWENDIANITVYQPRF